jgi:ribonuclease-3
MGNKQANTLSRGLSVIGKLLTGSRKGPSGQRVRLLRKLQKRIGVRFTDLSLLEQALTHRSYSHVTSQTRNDSNERMEFLGDSVLGLSVSQFLYLRFPDRTEGALSKMKSLLVSRKVLSAVSRDSGFGEYLLLSGEESEMGGRDRTSILADSFEGVIGAIYLDQGYRAANKFIQRFLLGNIHEILKDEEHTNYKSLLQEYVQSKRLTHPVYRVRREVGPEHEKEFAIEVVVRSEVWGKGRGRSKKDAEQNAARDALDSRQESDNARSRRGRRTRAPRAEETGAPASHGREGQSRGGRRRSGRAEPKPEPKPVAKRRGEHGAVVSREKLRAQRQSEAQERERRERERRDRRRTEPRSRPKAPAAGPERPAPETETPAEPNRRRGARRGRRRGPRPREGAETPSEGRLSPVEESAPTPPEPAVSDNGPTPPVVDSEPSAPPVPAEDVAAPEDVPSEERPPEPTPRPKSGGSFARRRRRVARGTKKR